MPWYEWTRSDPFRDHARSRAVEEGEVVELPVEVADPNPGFVDADAPNDESEDDESESEAGSEPDYAEMDYSELRQLAVDADTDEINGRSSKDEIVAFLSE